MGPMEFTIKTTNHTTRKSIVGAGEPKVSWSSFLHSQFTQNTLNSNSNVQKGYIVLQN